MTGSATNARCGLTAGTTSGTITLTSRYAIEIAGSDPKKSGFVFGATPAIQFVAGDFWLAEVRDEVLRAELEKLTEAQAECVATMKNSGTHECFAVFDTSTQRKQVSFTSARDPLAGASSLYWGRVTV